MTKEFVYRINYGPTCESDLKQAASFLYEQYYAIERHKRGKTRQSAT